MSLPPPLERRGQARAGDVQGTRRPFIPPGTRQDEERSPESSTLAQVPWGAAAAPPFCLTEGALTLAEGAQDLPVGWQRTPRADPALDSQKGSTRQVLLLLLPPSEGSQATGSLLPWVVPHRKMLCLLRGHLLYSGKLGQVSFVVPVPSQGLLVEMQLPGMEVWGTELPGFGHQLLPVGTECGCGKVASALPIIAHWAAMHAACPRL